MSRFFESYHDTRFNYPIFKLNECLSHLRNCFTYYVSVMASKHETYSDEVAFGSTKTGKLTNKFLQENMIKPYIYFLMNSIPVTNYLYAPQPFFTM